MKHLLIAGLLLFGMCSGAWAETGADKVIRLGVVAPLTGDFGYQGNYIRQGVELAAEKLRAEGATIEIFYEDACLPSKTLTAAQRLLQSEVHSIVGSYCIIGMVPMAPLLERNKVLTFQSSVIPDVLIESGDYVLTTNVAIEDEARELARMAYSRFNARRAGVLYFPSDWGENYNRYFTDEFESAGGRVVASDITQISQMDFRTELTRMKSRGVDVVFAAHISSALGIMVRQASELGMQVQFISTDEAEDPQFFTAAGTAANGVTILSPEPRIETAPVREFRQHYRNRFGHLPPAIASNAYDATSIAVSAILQCEFDRECMKEAVYRIDKFNGASGQFSIEADGRTVRQFTLKVAENGSFAVENSL